MERKITIEEHDLYQEDYQIRMLKANSLDGIFKVGARGMNGSSYYDYDVSGKVSMKAMYERSKISGEDLKLFLTQFKAVIKEVEAYLLNIHCILLKPEYIFYEESRFFFCYYPLAAQDLWEEFHTLTEYFVRQGDYEDQECIRLVFLLHKATMEENYSLEKIMAECLKRPEKDEKVDTVEEIEEMEYDEICQIMDINYQSAYNLLQRSLQKVRDTFGTPECIAWISILTTFFRETQKMHFL
mgnify:CR=1 FL=1